ncbi:TRAP transporter small permease subunit (plasmid) [Skermanella mucosa]|uniref:TRAP transporter small permease subunit n=1 Tax=Skermanella mucosa TaxID=1789672 RepID=UPI00192C78E3|nr:TRAP transporter small permease subunit [Skermanella mucosa]UEM24681.1 TRAP transporter small permease subunit [Skermanella mucosa]
MTGAGAIRACELLVEGIGRAVSWVSLALVLVMAGNVLLRYGFSTGSVAMQELEWHLMSPLALLGMSYAIQHEGHVRVDVLYGRMPALAQRIIEALSFLLVAVVAALLVKLSIPYVMLAYRLGEGSANPGGLPWRFLLKSFIPLGFALLFIQSLAGMARAVALPRPRSLPHSAAMAGHGTPA